jgi:hypothetical protein
MFLVADLDAINITLGSLLAGLWSITDLARPSRRWRQIFLPQDPLQRGMGLDATPSAECNPPRSARR